MQDLYIALVHYPILNKQGQIVTTSVTNFDLHDLSRNGQTFGIKRVFIITPAVNQINMVNFIHNYWSEGTGAAYNPYRKQAFELLSVSKNIDDTCLTIKNLSGSHPHLVATTAKEFENSVSYDFVRDKLETGDRPVLLAFGTGFGLAPEFFEKVDFVLKPITGVASYNHLPVRSAVAIILDRLIGRT